MLDFLKQVCYTSIIKERKRGKSHDKETDAESKRDSKEHYIDDDSYCYVLLVFMV